MTALARLQPTPAGASALEALAEVLSLSERVGTSLTTDIAIRIGLDLGPLWARGYAIAAVPSWIAGGRGDIASEESPVALAIEVRDATDEQTVDVVLVDPERPARFGLMFGRGEFLDAWHAKNPASFYGGRALRLHRDPLAWVRARCDGAVLLESGRAWRLLPELPGPVMAEDIAHARQLARLTRGYVDPFTIRVPRNG